MHWDTVSLTRTNFIQRERMFVLNRQNHDWRIDLRLNIVFNSTDLTIDEPVEYWPNFGVSTMVVSPQSRRQPTWVDQRWPNSGRRRADTGPVQHSPLENQEPASIHSRRYTSDGKGALHGYFELDELFTKTSA